jgi:hypothetical protein
MLQGRGMKPRSSIFSFSGKGFPIAISLLFPQVQRGFPQIPAELPTGILQLLSAVPTSSPSLASLGSGAFGSILLITLAGLPATTQKSSTPLVTTLPAPTVTPLPIVTPGHTIAFPPNQQSSPIVIGAPNSGPLIPLRRNGSRGWAPEKKEQFGPTRVRAPIVMGDVSMNVQSLLMKAPFPSLFARPS